MNSSQPSLEEQLEELKRGIAAAQKEVERAQVDARAAADELQQFVYAASHDLQEPLRAIRTYAQLLEREHQQGGDVSELVSIIIASANSMDRLVKDLLTYSRSASSPQLAPVNLHTPVQWALLKLADTIKESGAQVLSGDLPEVYADERLIASVFEQLFTNSIRYRTADAPRVHISAEEQDDFYVIAVTDNGEGIPAEYHEQIFAPFKRLHGKKIPGSGLGLSICRKIVRAHSGRIWVESDGKAGSTFKFTLPA